MQGHFEISQNQYPWHPANIGNDIAVVHAGSGEIDIREPVAGEYKSPERNEQNARFTARSIELSNASRASRKAPDLT